MIADTTIGAGGLLTKKRVLRTNGEFSVVKPVVESGKKARLSSISMCDKDGLCLPPTTFNYSDAGELHFGFTDNPINRATIDGKAGHLGYGDWNGDGLIDIMWYDKYDGRNRWFINNGNLGFTQFERPDFSKVPHPFIQGLYSKFDIHFGDTFG